MKTIIFIRHGNTDKSDRSPERHLTRTGKLNIMQKAKEISQRLEIKNVLVITSDTNRAKETGEIIADKLNTGNLVTRDVRIKGLGQIAENLDNLKKQNKSLVEYYLSLSEYTEFGIESPENFVLRIEKIVKEFRGYDCLFFVTHEISLEVFVSLAKSFKAVYKSYSRVTNYGDYAILIGGGDLTRGAEAPGE